MGQLANVRVVDPVLTSLARGYSNGEFIGDKLFPFVPVDKEGGKIPLFGKEAFAVYDTERAIRAASNQMSLNTLNTTPYALTEHDLEAPIDYREESESMMDLKKIATDTTMGAIRLKHEKLAADLAQNAANYPAANKETLVANQFNDADIDPVTIIDSKSSALRTIIGKRPNAMFMGAVVYDALKNHIKLINRIQYSQVGVLTLDLMKALFGIPNIYVGEAVFSTDNATFTDIWRDNVVLAYISKPTGIGSSVYEPSFGYTLQKKGMPQVDTRPENGGKLTVVRATDIFDIKIVGIESAYLLTDVLG